MKTMTLPGYAANASLYRSSRPYVMAGAGGAMDDSADIVPQQIGCISRSLGTGPLSVTVRCCAFPPRCCLRACAFGACRSFCIP
jgi:hypothetical protein